MEQDNQSLHPTGIGDRELVATRSPMRPRKVILTVILAMAIVCGVVRLLMPGEPRYQGKSLSEWLRSLDKSPIPILVGDLAKTAVVDANHTAACAIMHMGSEAEPVLVRELRARDSPPKLWLMELLRKQSVIRIDLTPARARHRRAIQACSALGPRAKAMLAELTKLLRETRVDPGLPRVLAMIEPDALPSIIVALTNSDAQVKWQMATALCQISFDAEAAVPALVACLKETEDYRVRCHAAMALAHIRRRPDLVLPALTKNLSDTNRDVRRMSAQALEQFRMSSPEIP